MVAAVSVMGYDAYYVALEAIKAAGSTDPAAVLAALPPSTTPASPATSPSPTARRTPPATLPSSSTATPRRLFGTSSASRALSNFKNNCLRARAGGESLRLSPGFICLRCVENAAIAATALSRRREHWGGRSMDFFKLLPYLLSGISVGGQYALIAVGYTMVYGILRLINFAHGDVFMVAGPAMVYAVTWMPLWLAIPFVIVFTVLLGFIIERVAYKPPAPRRGCRS